MTQAEISAEALIPRRRQRLDWVIPALLRPRSTFERIVQDRNPNWVVPIILIVIFAALQAIASAKVTQALSAGGQFTLPPNFQYFSPEQQAQLEQALAVSSGPVFTYVFPVGLAVGRVLLGWLIIGAGLHLVRTLMGGRGTSRSVMNLVAWAGLPFMVRDIVRIFYALIAQEPIHFPGLSGFAPIEEGRFSLMVAEFLKLVDVYWLWHIALLTLGVYLFLDLSRSKVVASVIIIQVIGIGIQLLPGLIAYQLGNLDIIRPFF